MTFYSNNILYHIHIGFYNQHTLLAIAVITTYITKQGNGIADAIAVDTKGDGVFDALDTNMDGTLDAALAPLDASRFNFNPIIKPLGASRTPASSLHLHIADSMLRRHQITTMCDFTRLWPVRIAPIHHT